MTNLSVLFRRQEEWQKSLRHLPWAEKLRMAARLRESVAKLRRVGSPEADDAKKARLESSRDPHSGQTPEG
jgi:hypothetical protein